MRKDTLITIPDEDFEDRYYGNNDDNVKKS